MWMAAGLLSSLRTAPRHRACQDPPANPHSCTTPRMPGHPDSVAAMLAYDQDSVITGSGDGMIRILSVQVGADRLGMAGGVHAWMLEGCIMSGATTRVLGGRALSYRATNLWLTLPPSF